MRYPDFLPQNGRIGFVAPSFGCSTEPYRSAFDNALKKFKDMGYSCVIGPNAYEDKGVGISNTPEKCAAEFMDFYLNDRSDVIMSCGGGELMCEILPHIDFEALKEAPPKWFQGYSDNTNILLPLVTYCDTAGIYGPCANSFGMEPWHRSLDDTFDLITGKAGTSSVSFEGYPLHQLESLKDEENPLAPYNCTEPTVRVAYIPDGYSAGKKGREACTENADISVKGRLLGGCLDILALLAGTKYDHVAAFNERYAKDGVLWSLEACDLNPLQCRRAIWQLGEAGWFDNAKGFLIGRPYIAEEAFGIDRFDAVLTHLAKYNVPIIFDVDTGHVAPQLPLVMGSLATASLKGNDFTIKMEL